MDSRLVTEAGTQTPEACQESSYPNWNTGQGRIWEPEGCPGIRSGHGIRAWPGSRLTESETGAVRVRAGPRPQVMRPGQPVSEDRGAERQVARQGLQPLSKCQAKLSQLSTYSQM